MRSRNATVRAMTPEEAGRWYEDIMRGAIERDEELGLLSVEREAVVGDGRYRVDFMLTTRGGFKFSVEVDGYKFHHSTPWLSEAHYRRQRYILAQGVRTIHFAVREVDFNCPGCVRELKAIVRAFSGDETNMAEEARLAQEVSDEQA